MNNPKHNSKRDGKYSAELIENTERMEEEEISSARDCSGKVFLCTEASHSRGFN